MTGADSAPTRPIPTTSANVDPASAPTAPTSGSPPARPDWTNTSSLITPNFGDYTDNASVGTTTYYSWSDGRIGVPQPFTDHH